MKKQIGFLISLSLLFPLITQATSETWDVFTWEFSTDISFRSAVEQVTELRNSLSLFKNRLNEMDAASKEKHDWTLDEQYKEVRTEMVKVIQDINNSTQKITSTLKSLYKYKEALKENIETLNETKQHLEIAKNYLNQLLVLVYKMEREIYTESWEEVDLLKTFVKSDVMPQLLAWDDTLRILLNQINTLLQKTSIQEKQKEESVNSLLNLKVSAQKSLDYYKTEMKKLEQKKAYLISFMQLYSEKKLQEAVLTDNAFEERNLQEAINGLVGDIVQKKYLDTNGLKEKIAALSQHVDSSENEASPVAWPTYPITQILTVFKDQAYERENGFKNLWLKLSIDYGTPIYAMRDWIVYYVDNWIAWINWIMIMHTDGYISTYAYLSKIYVQQGDYVKRGQVIAQSWWEPWTQWAGFISKGANLTFSLYKDGVAIDPLTVLDLSVVQDREKVLPEEYRLKYFNDQIIRTIDVTNVSLLKGRTVDERAQTFLNSYAVGTYRNLSFWDEVVKGTNIDRDMVICIAFAESTLGRFLSTDNNIGNVWNNDRWDRIAYANPYNGARLIPLTLNNQYLGNYHTIKQLSRYGNDEWKIYASSPINWQSNVQKCLSKIKWFYIPEDYPFRTAPNPNGVDNGEIANNGNSEIGEMMNWSVMKKINGVAVQQ